MKLRVIVALLSAALITMVFALTSGAGPTGGCTSDTDLDGVCDVPGDDNCNDIPNAGQRDDDEDGYGNVCDEDITQDCITGGPDLSLMFQNFGISSPSWGGFPERAAFDVNEDNAVGGPDLSQTFQRFGLPPGPTSRICADCAATPQTGVCP